MGFSTPSPPNIPLPPPAAHPAILGSSQTALAGQTQQSASKKTEGMGLNDTVKTTPKGLQTAPETAKTTLLG